MRGFSTLYSPMASDCVGRRIGTSETCHTLGSAHCHRQFLPMAFPVKPVSSEQPLQFDKFPNRYLPQDYLLAPPLRVARWRIGLRH